MRIICSKETRSYIIRESRDTQGQLAAKPYVSCVTENVNSEHVISDELTVPNEATQITIEGVSYQIKNRSFNTSTDELDIYITKIEVEEVGKSAVDEQLIPLIREWNAQEINKNKRLAAFCRVLNKAPEEVCVEDLALALSSPNYLPNIMDCTGSGPIVATGITTGMISTSAINNRV